MPQILKSILKSLRDKLTRIFAPPLQTKSQKSLLILRVDAIGDYVLFAPFIKSIRAFFSDFHITLIANSCLKDLALGLHSTEIDEFIFINPKRFQRNLFYRIHFLRTLKKRHFTLCLNPLYSRDLICKELISRINAQISITPNGDDNNLSQALKSLDDAYYTALAPCRDGILFEYYRNDEFCKYIFKNLQFLRALCRKGAESRVDSAEYKTPKARLDSAKFPKIEDFIDKNTSAFLCQNYCVLFIGASQSYRKWSIQNFAKVAQYLIEKYAQNIVICGGAEDAESGKNLVNLVKSKHIIDLTGKTTLMQLAALVYNGNLVISNESCAAHFAAFLDTAIIAVSNGNHLGRFIPYPRGISDKYYPVFHPFITENPSHYQALSNSFAYKSTLNINKICADDVIKIIDQILKEKK